MSYGIDKLEFGVKLANLVRHDYHLKGIVSANELSKAMHIEPRMKRNSVDEIKDILAQYFSDVKESTDSEWNEAFTLVAYELLMPYKLFKKRVYEIMNNDKDYSDTILVKLSGYFNVSELEAYHRLVMIGLVDPWRGWFD